MNNQSILKIIDASINKWQWIVWPTVTYLKRERQRHSTITECPLCHFFVDCERYSDKGILQKCPIFEFTRKPDGAAYMASAYCRNTSFYRTAFWLRRTGYHTISKINIQANNHMLSELYEVRRRFIASMYERK